VIDALAGFGIGVVLGAATGVPLGVVNLAVVEAATRAGVRDATAIGAGGALADGVHAALAFAGIAPLVTAHALVRRILIVVSAAIVTGYAIVIARRRARAPDEQAPASSMVRTFLLGVSLTLPNPAPLAAWIAVGDLVVPDASPMVAWSAAVGVVFGSAAWFACLARLTARRVLGGRTARWLSRVVAVLLFGMVGVALARELF